MDFRKRYRHAFTQRILRRSIPFAILLPLSVTCRSQEDTAYSKRLENWHLSRMDELRSENGWLNLAGLFWLKPGMQSFGGSKEDDIPFPEGRMPRRVGSFHLSGDTVRMTASPDIGVKMDGRPVIEALAYHQGMAEPPVFRHGSLAWTVIRRGDLTGIRLRDLDHPSLKTFKGVERFPVDGSWLVEARLVKHAVPTRIPIANVLGQTNLLPSPGRVVFEHKGLRHSLDVLEEGDRLFILFADETNARETYPSGRFLYAEKPGPEGTLILDFNMSINPPCAFTPYATCPLPPVQNRLPLEVRAGEKDPGMRGNE